MLNFIKRIRNLQIENVRLQSPIIFSAKDPLTPPPLSPEVMAQIAAILEENKLRQEPQGDGRAAFLSDMTPAEYEDYKHKEIDGWGPFLKKIFSLPSHE